MNHGLVVGLGFLFAHGHDMPSQRRSYKAPRISQLELVQFLDYPLDNWNKLFLRCVCLPNYPGDLGFAFPGNARCRVGFYGSSHGYVSEVLILNLCLGYRRRQV